MGDFASWSVNLGRWYGVRVRIHIFFCLFAVQALYMASASRPQGMVVFAAATLGLLLISVLLHEVGHCWAAVRVGGYAEQIVLWPLGGLSPPQVPHEPQLELVTALAGPVVNLVIMATTAPLLLLARQDLLGLLIPLSPIGLTEGAIWVVGLKLVFWINWLLVLVNLLPFFPFDSGRGFRSFLWSQFDKPTAVHWVTRSAMIAAALMCVCAWLVRDTTTASLVPAWVPLLLLAIFLFFGAQQEAARLEAGNAEDELDSYDFSQGYTSLERDLNRHRSAGPGPIRRWLDDRRAERRRRQAALEREEEQQVDAILARLHESGLNGLSALERALLERVSARYRNRTRS
jgi:stage IV sporulation protein FB